MTVTDLSRAEWRKSSYSSQDGNCVEVAVRSNAACVLVRDSKDADHPVLALGLADWRRFTDRIKD